ncbi:ipa protein [Ophiocordyceps sinensis CO18]|uniref:Ipa protein n=1 Tax=Ophiocordyceps sinensis (strain Co18 / CGMCC 3.14243) TaxID=911162 RepID=T5A8N9_OPHSC|nr:ipa protein [Ophiocordyceps sinensis CO18]
MHGATVEAFWRSLDRDQRAKCLPLDSEHVHLPQICDEPWGVTLENWPSSLVPEWDLCAFVEEGSETLLDLIKHRATKSLYTQHCYGVNDDVGDYRFVLKHNRFVDGQKYGMVFEVFPGSYQAEVLDVVGTSLQFASWPIGSLILLRQFILSNGLRSIFQTLVEEASKPRPESEPPQTSDKAAIAAPPEPIVQAPPAKFALSDLVVSARDQRDSHDENLELLRTEPLVLIWSIESCLHSQPEAIADEQGHRCLSRTDSQVLAAIFQTVHAANQSAGTWSYIVRLLELLESCDADQAYRRTLLQEITNACHVEYIRAQALFRQHVQTATAIQCFERASNALDEAGNPRVSMIGDLEDLAHSDAQLYYVLRLCQPDTNAARAAYWIAQLDALHQADPPERERLTMRETRALWDLFIIIQLIQNLSLLTSMPPFSRKKRRAFVSRSRKLEAELDQIGKQMNAQQLFAQVPRIYEPAEAQDIFEYVDERVAEKAGAKMSLLYQNLVEGCLCNIRNQYPETKPQEAQKEKNPQWIPFPASNQQPPSNQIEPQRRRQKQKTRPPHSSVLNPAPPAEPTAPEQVVEAPQITVSLSTAAVFSKVFANSQARGPVSWVAFEAAMVDLGFSVGPKCGSTYHFLPVNNPALDRPVSFHRPHESHIEGIFLRLLGRRLKRVYGWGRDTFQVA